MYQVKYIETMGTGLTDLLDACKANGLKRPLLEEVPSGFRIVIWRPSANDQDKVPLPGPVNGLVNGPVKGPVKGQVFWNEGSFAGKLDLQPISPAVLKVFECIENQPGCRQNNLAQQTGISERRVKRYIAELKKKNLVEFRGAPKNGGYWVTDRGRR